MWSKCAKCVWLNKYYSNAGVVICFLNLNFELKGFLTSLHYWEPPRSQAKGFYIMSKNSQRALLTASRHRESRLDFSIFSSSKTNHSNGGNELGIQHVRSGEEFLFIVSEETVILDVNPKLLPKLEDFAGEYHYGWNCFQTKLTLRGIWSPPPKL